MVKTVSACNAGDLGSIPGLGRFPWRREWLPTSVFLPGKPHGQRGLAGYSPWSCKELDPTVWLIASLSLHLENMAHEGKAFCLFCAKCLAWKWYLLICVIFIYHLWSMENGLGQPPPAGCGQPLTGASTHFASLERCFLQAFLSLQQEPRNSRLRTDRLILSAGFPAYFKTQPPPLALGLPLCQETQ